MPGGNVRVVKGFISWVGRKGLLYALLVAAILASTFVVPFIAAVWNGPTLPRDRALRLERLIPRITHERDQAQQRLRSAVTTARTQGLADLELEIARLRRERDFAVAGRRSWVQQSASLVTADVDAIWQDKECELEIQLDQRQIDALTLAATELRAGDRAQFERARLENAEQSIATLMANARISQQRCLEARQATKIFEARWPYWLTIGLFERAQHEKLLQTGASACTSAAQWRSAFENAKHVRDKARIAYSAAVRAYEQAKRWTVSTIDITLDDITQRIEEERVTAKGSLRAKINLWAEQVHLGRVLEAAVWALLWIMATPYLIRLLFFFVLAPFAARRPVIRLRTAAAGDTIPLPARSSTSVGVRLAAGEELLVRQDYLQSSSHVGTKRTQWLLDWRHPMSSLVTGLAFLTRLRGDGEMTTISAIHDPFAEVTLLTLPEGAACVLQPRALAAVAQPIGRPLRITSHWRLTSLNAWLTLQLRYLVFHGPARLVLKGGRGVRVERAERGRVFGQDQLIGFSAELAYSVMRAETFWPYFVGREQLLKDRIEGGAGVLIVEEAPMAGRKDGEPRRGLEGAMDAALKVVGL